MVPVAVDIGIVAAANVSCCLHRLSIRTLLTEQTFGIVRARKGRRWYGRLGAGESCEWYGGVEAGR